MADPVRSIVIVGGGSAGWMTAAFLSRFLDPSRCRMTLVESRVLGTIGVGEATVPPMVSFLRLLGIDEDEFLVRCNATYKLAIRFSGWHSRGPVWHPFGHVGAPMVENLPTFHHWLKQRREGHDEGAYTDYSLAALLAAGNKGPRPLRGPSSLTQQGAYAYHVNAQEFAGYLAEYAERRGVRRVMDDVIEVKASEGRIESLRTAHSGELSADLYIDCSGFSGLLIEQSLGADWEDGSAALLCDRAMVTPVPPSGAMPSFTESVALSAGWMWRIPLSHRFGCGYVYSSRFIDDQSAEDELMRQAGVYASRTELRTIRMRVGRRAAPWTGNCVAIGLAAGFLEPLESTGLYLVQKGVELLLDHFPDHSLDPVLASEYNRRLGAEFDHVRDFLLLHYRLNDRAGTSDPTGFWTASREAATSPSLDRTLAVYDRTGLVDWEGQSLFRDSSFYCIAAGFDRLPRTYHAMADQVDGVKARETLQRIRTQNAAVAAVLPDHSELIRAVHAARRA